MKVKLYLILILVIIIMCLCKWEASSIIEANTFTTDEEVGSDAYYIDSLSFIHPEWSYERCEEELFN